MTYAPEVSLSDFTTLQETIFGKGATWGFYNIDRDFHVSSGAPIVAGVIASVAANDIDAPALKLLKGGWEASPAFTDLFTKLSHTTSFAHEWTRRAHINELELEALLLVIQHCQYAVRFRGSNVWFGLDSAVALGC